jgi:hypothetical protein
MNSACGFQQGVTRNRFGSAFERIQMDDPTELPMMMHDEATIQGSNRLLLRAEHTKNVRSTAVARAQSI